MNEARENQSKDSYKAKVLKETDEELSKLLDSSIRVYLDIENASNIFGLVSGFNQTDRKIVNAAIAQTRLDHGGDYGDDKVLKGVRHIGNISKTGIVTFSRIDHNRIMNSVKELSTELPGLKLDPNAMELLDAYKKWAAVGNMPDKVKIGEKELVFKTKQEAQEVFKALGVNPADLSFKKISKMMFKGGEDGLNNFMNHVAIKDWKDMSTAERDLYSYIVFLENVSNQEKIPKSYATAAGEHLMEATSTVVNAVGERISKATGYKKYKNFKAEEDYWTQ